MLVQYQIELQYSYEYRYNRAGGVPVFTSRRVLKKGGSKGGFPPG